ncbi:MAG: glutamate-semialdehyde -aminomutase [Chloroflexota bacterium]|nr:glutamate-semialdehyde -aminomutase [Chloroflexota bacterium]
MPWRLPASWPGHSGVDGARSRQLFARALDLFPGGVNSPVRAFRAVGGEPPFIESGSGARVRDADGRTYLDFVSSWGPLILGHAHPAVVAAIEEAARRGTTFGASTEREVELGELVRLAFPSMERMRFVSSGTEATMSALRLARAFTGRSLVLKVDGGYHGHSDALLVAAGSGLMTLGVPASAGVPEAVAATTLSVPYNDLELAERAFREHQDAIAALIVEPVAGNMGVVPPQPGFLRGLRELTERRGALLVFDEVITGFRVAWGGAQQMYGVVPDLTCLGKIIGGGLPVGAYGGRREIMGLIAPEGPVYQAGTLSGNPLAMAAGAATLRELQKPETYERLEALGATLGDGIAAAAARAEILIQLQRVGSMLTPFFTDAPVTDYVSAQRADTRAYARLFGGALARGIYPPPSQFEAWFVSLAHTDVDVAQAVQTVGAALAEAASD